MPAAASSPAPSTSPASGATPENVPVGVADGDSLSDGDGSEAPGGVVAGRLAAAPDDGKVVGDGLAVAKAHERASPGVTSGGGGSATQPGSTWVKFAHRYSRMVRPESWILFARSRPT